MNKKLALKVLNTKRGRGRPSKAVSEKLAKARAILGVKKGHSVAKADRYWAKNRGKVKKALKKASRRVERAVPNKWEVWVYWPANLEQDKVKKIVTATKVAGAKWFGDGCGMGECDVSFEVTGKAAMKKLTRQVKALKIRGLSVEVKPWTEEVRQAKPQLYKVGEIIKIKEDTKQGKPWIKGAWRGRVVRYNGEGSYHVKPIGKKLDWVTKPEAKWRNKGIFVTASDIKGKSH